MVYLAWYLGFDRSDEELLGVFDTADKAKSAVDDRLRRIGIITTWEMYGNTTTEFAEDESSDTYGSVEARPLQ